MPRPLTALVLTPSLGGDFFGDVLAGLSREIVGAKGRLVVVQTLQGFAPREQVGTPTDFDTRVGWSEVDGAVSITSAVGEDYLWKLRKAGKPVVLLSGTQMEDFRAPIARPDNQQGAFAAVDHLIGHGHTRIGFVGNMVQRDVRDRFDGYRQALEAHGLSADPALLFVAPDNSGMGGVMVARSVLSAPDRPTALMVATDRNAIGLMRALSDAGLDTPRDIAIAAFDNIAAGTYSIPALTSVDPRFDEVGALAGRILLGKIRGDKTPDTTVTPGSAALVVRDSCGCDGDLRRGRKAGADEASEALADHLVEELRSVLERPLRVGDEDLDRRTRESVEATVREAVGLLDPDAEATNAEVQALASSLRRLTSDTNTLRRFTDAMMEYAQRAEMSNGRGTTDASPVSARIAAALWKVQAGAFLHQTEMTDAAIAEQYVVDGGLLETGGSDPRDLRWLNGTSVRSGALALWEDNPSSGRMKIVGVYDPTGQVPNVVGTVLPCEDFPPGPLIATGIAAGRKVCYVVPVSTRMRNWGLLSVVAEIDSTTERETYQHWAALLCAALESQRRQEVVRKSALFDGLTGLPNRYLFIQQLDKVLARWKRSRTPFSVLFLDLDGFKVINDSLGHQMGDRVLKAVADEISRGLREVDTAARFGGDEFVILLPDTDPGPAMVAAKRIQAMLDKVREFDGHEIVMRASVGIASSAVEYTSTEEILRDADAAMYRAKSVEPGSVAYFDAPMHESAVRRAVLAQDILFALKENQFEVHYQPIVNLDSGRTDRFEALVRWRHPERGLIEPTEFITEIEETSLIIELGHRVLDEVCRQLAEWGPRVANVSINISDREFWSQDLLSHVLTTLEQYGLAPDVLTLEITEGVLMRRPEVALRIMHKLHEAGLMLHIDDFGTGYSSLQTLHRFPVEAFKIDRSFIQTLTSEDKSAELISSLVNLGKSLGLSVVAEGVETEEQLAFLRELGCSRVQGYLFMPAVNAEHAGELLGKSLHEVESD
ncbi:MAG: EAL domain-containing protein [Demequinaceae bacterium]|nr:EAL domain-containing protein [Demequinaceae bacterium]